MISAPDWKRRVGPALPENQGWRFRAKLAYRAPVDWVMLGVLGEGSGSTPNHLYVWAVAMPLFVPSEHIALDHSRRVGSGAQRWDETELADAATAALRELPSQHEALARIARADHEASGYALLLLGDFSGAERRLREPFAPGDDRQFVADARQRRHTVLGSLHDEGIDATVALLRKWRDVTCDALHIR